MKLISLFIIMIMLSACSTLKKDEDCFPKIDQKTQAMDSKLQMQFNAIPMEMTIKILGEFIGYEVLRPNDIDMKYPIAINYNNVPWITIFEDICVTNKLRCGIKDKTIYFAPEEYLKTHSFPNCTCR